MGTTVLVTRFKMVLVPRALRCANHHGRHTVPATGDRRRRKYRMRLRRLLTLAQPSAIACLPRVLRGVS